MDLMELYPIRDKIYKFLLVLLMLQFTIDVKAENRCASNKTTGVVDCSNRDYNKIPEDIPSWVITLNLNRNPLDRLTNDSFSNLSQTNLKNLYLHDCHLSEIEAGVFRPLPKSLQNVDISYNKALGLDKALKSVFGLLNRNITSFIIDEVNDKVYGTITGASSFYLKNVCLKIFSLKKNHIKIIESPLFASGIFTKCLEELYIAENNIVGDVIDIPEWIDLPNLRVIDFSDRYIPDSQFVARAPERTKSIQLSPDPWQIPIPPKLEKAILFNFGSHANPFQDAHFVSGTNMRVLNLANFTFKSCNGTISGLENLEDADFSGWHCSILSLNMVSKLSSLRTFRFSNAELGQGLKTDHDGIFFRSLDKLEELHLSYNQLAHHSKQWLDVQQKSLVSLYLDNNLLEELPIDVASFKKLTTLDIRNNKLTHLTKSERESINSSPQKDKLSLLMAGNSFVCTCKTLDFVTWIYEKNHVQLDRDKYACALEDGTASDTRTVYGDMKELRRRCEEKNKSKVWIVLLVLGLTFCVLAIVIAILGYRYRHRYLRLVKIMHNKGYDVIDGDTIVEHEVSASTTMSTLRTDTSI